LLLVQERHSVVPAGFASRKPDIGGAELANWRRRTDSTVKQKTPTPSIDSDDNSYLRLDTGAGRARGAETGPTSSGTLGLARPAHAWLDPMVSEQYSIGPVCHWTQKVRQTGRAVVSNTVARQIV